MPSRPESSAASVDDTCFCPHAGPCCHSDHGCCEACCDEAEFEREEAEVRALSEEDDHAVA